MGSSLIAHKALSIDSETMTNQLVCQKYRDKTTLAS